MPRSFKLPDLGEGIHEAEVEDILVAVGDEVEEDQNILVVETDKASVEIPSPYSGTVEEIRVEIGDLVRVGDVLITFSGEGAPDEAPEEASEEAPQGAPQGAAEEEEEKAVEATPEEAEEGEERKRGGEGPVPASPATRRLARELDVDLREVPPSGPAGRVTAEDVRGFAERGPEKKAKEKEAEEREERREERGERRAGGAVVRPSSVPIPPLPDFERWGDVERVPLRSVRRATAKQMALSWSQIPHVSHQDEADVTELEQLRRRYKAEIETGSLTMTVFVMKAVVAALKAHPRFNASLDADEEAIVLKHYYHLGIAVDTERGLVVPVIRDVDRKSIVELSAELVDVVEQTREGTIALEALQGGSFTITNVGMLGGTNFSPIINYPEVAILGMARARWKPVVRPQGDGEEREIVPRFILPLVVAFDHRVADGADAARFMRQVVEMLENPDKLMLMM